MQDGPDYMFLFNTYSLDPNTPAHVPIIEGYLAQIKFSDSYDSIRAEYIRRGLSVSVTSPGVPVPEVTPETPATPPEITDAPVEVIPPEADTDPIPQDQVQTVPETKKAKKSKKGKPEADPTPTPDAQ